MGYDAWKTRDTSGEAEWVDRGCPGCNPDLLHDDVPPCDDDCAATMHARRRLAAIESCRESIARNELLIARYLVEGGDRDTRIPPCLVRIAWERGKLEALEAARAKAAMHGEEAA